jgi:hypothetical protein
MEHLDPELKNPEDRREVNPPIEVESPTWSAGGTIDWWVKERGKWMGRVRRPDGRQVWIKAADLRPGLLTVVDERKIQRGGGFTAYAIPARPSYTLSCRWYGVS